MKPHAEQSVTMFLDALAGSQIGPAGGAAAAVSGALGAATVAFVCDRIPPADTLSEARQTCLDQRDTLLALASQDTAALKTLYDKTPSSPSMDDRTQHIPIAIAEACETVLTTAARVADAVSSPVRADLLTGGHLAYGGLQAAIQIGWTNRNLNETTTTTVEQRLTTSQEAGETAYQQLITAL